ncbi:3-methyladenine DNA glycosylase [Citricoccus sp. SGAir0253]|uniref:DNA-3-methyladenine glycosylase family protein n=1 Tax=Citricoccus sp. SGAir0253 TaxID=2567881 RepID=UPI0010CCEEEE|nr:3-methyladenine DNA glycosylase [Citricoccus sp. SGAir0253]QCU77417.1 3-methyladenine DNA glycosylase [Citricoccus sp. SGAir0253]
MPSLPPIGPLPAPDAAAVLEPGAPVDVRLTLGVLQRGHADPTVQSRPEGVWLVFRQPGTGDPVTLLVRPAASPHEPGRVPVLAWGPGARAAVAAAPALLGLDDDWSGLDALLAAGVPGLPAAVVRARRAHPGLRLPATGRVVDQLLMVVLEQKVTHDQARSGWRWLVRRYGDLPPAPAPEGMRLAPTAEAVRRVPSWEWHAGWVQPAQSRAMLRVAERARALDRLGAQPLGAEDDPGSVVARLCSVPGLGPWTAAETVQRTHGAPDTVAVGDFHLAHHVGEALTGRRTDDAGMLRLLAPYAGHRQRVVRLIGLAGYRFSRFGPRLAPADHRGR